jgi:hypothetical protein
MPVVTEIKPGKILKNYKFNYDGTQKDQIKIFKIAASTEKGNKQGKYKDDIQFSTFDQ